MDKYLKSIAIRRYLQENIPNIISPGNDNYRPKSGDQFRRPGDFVHTQEAPAKWVKWAPSVNRLQTNMEKIK